MSDYIIVLISVFLVLVIVLITSKYYDIETFASSTNTKNKKSKTKLFSFPDGQFFKIKADDALCLDVEYDVTLDVIRAVVKPSSESIGQEWYQKDGRIFNKLNHLALSVYRDVKADGVPVYLTVPRQTNGQYWIIDDMGVIRSRLFGGKLSFPDSIPSTQTGKKGKKSNAESTVNTNIIPVNVSKVPHTTRKWEIINTGEISPKVEPTVKHPTVDEIKQSHRDSMKQKLTSILNKLDAKISKK
jgi:hypothetical protein